MTSCSVEKHCPVCNIELPKGIEYAASSEGLKVDCPVCGFYHTTGMVLVTNAIKSEIGERTHILSAILRRKSTVEHPVLLDNESAVKLIESSILPKTPIEKMDAILLYFAEQSDEAGKTILINTDQDYPLAYAKNVGEFQFFLNNLKEAELLHYSGSMSERKYSLTIAGWQKALELSQKSLNSNQAFVAMWFDDSMKPVWKNAIEPALKDSGYDPVRIDAVEHNNKICDEIISGIRQSGLLVADFTGQRGGVYFEAGFAMGLGIPVIWTCKKEDVNNLHFDTRQYNHIVWTDEDDLYKQLKKRIEATGLIRNNITTK